MVHVKQFYGIFLTTGDCKVNDIYWSIQDIYCVKLTSKMYVEHQIQSAVNFQSLLKLSRELFLNKFHTPRHNAFF